MLNIQDVHKTYRTRGHEVQAIKGVSLVLEPGEFVAVRGQSGSGKSTLLMMAGGLMSPDSGTITVAGEKPYAMSPDRRAQFRAANVGFVFQQFHLVPYLTVLDNVIAPSIAAPKPAVNDRARALIEQFGLADRIQHVPNELSSGERQRVAFARALLNDPKLILADEPTGNLDEENSTVVLDRLAEFARNGGSVLLVTHDPVAAEGAHKSVLLDHGSIVA